MHNGGIHGDQLMHVHEMHFSEGVLLRRSPSFKRCLQRNRGPGPCSSSCDLYQGLCPSIASRPGADLALSCIQIRSVTSSVGLHG